MQGLCLNYSQDSHPHHSPHPKKEGKIGEGRQDKARRDTRRMPWRRSEATQPALVIRRYPCMPTPLLLIIVINAADHVTAARSSVPRDNLHLVLQLHSSCSCGIFLCLSRHFIFYFYLITLISLPVCFNRNQLLLACGSPGGEVRVGTSSETRTVVMNEEIRLSRVLL